MHHTFLRKAIFALIGMALAMTLMAVPLGASANAAPQPTVTVKAYDMDEYLDMLWETNQYDRYAKFATIANQEAWEKHIANRDALSENSDPVAVVIANAEWLGFDVDHDTFRTISVGNETAKVKVVHGRKRYIVTLVSDDDGNWEIKTVYRAKILF